MKLSENTKMALIGVLGAAGAFVVFHGSAGAGPKDPLEAVPSGSFLVGTLDMQSLRASPLYDAVASKDAAPAGAAGVQRPAIAQVSHALGIPNLAEACGFDPLARVGSVAVAIPEEGDHGEFGVASRIEVSRSELEKCTSEISRARGGHAANEPKVVGDFAVVESDDNPGGPRLAYGAGGLLLVGRGAWLDAMMKAAEHHDPGIKASEHATLRSALTSRAGFAKPTLLITAILPQSLRDRLRNEMGDEAHDKESSSVMAGVLGVASLGVAVKAGLPHQDLEAAAELACETPDDCETVEKLILKKRGEWSRDIMLRIAGFGPIFDSLVVNREGTHLHLTAHANTEQMASAIQRAIQHSRRQPDLKGPRLGTGRTEGASHKIDEILHPDGGIAPGIHFQRRDAGASETSQGTGSEGPARPDAP
jgi:hypothetical protein